MADYFRPLLSTDPARAPHAPRLGGGWCWFDRVEHLRRDRAPEVVPVSAVPTEVFDQLTTPRAPMLGLALDRPRVMGILNVTPDSFSDGGRFFVPDAAIAEARRIAPDIDVLDVGAESTRPGAEDVCVEEELRRLRPILRGLVQDPGLPPVSLDTRKAAVARAGLGDGISMVNDVSGLRHDPEMAALVAAAQVPVVLVHSPAAPRNMQAHARYDHVLLDVYDALAAAVAAAGSAGIPKHRIILDPGIGFGKTADHNVALVARLSLFHSLGCALLVGASRKRFLGRIAAGAGAAELAPAARLPGSLAVALAAIRAGVHIVRVHDTAETAQALRVEQALWKAGSAQVAGQQAKEAGQS